MRAYTCQLHMHFFEELALQFSNKVSSTKIHSKVEKLGWGNSAYTSFWRNCCEVEKLNDLLLLFKKSIGEMIKWQLFSLSVWSKCLGKFGNIWKMHLAEYGPRQG